MSPQTRRRVEAAARRLGYRPNRSAQILRGQPHRVLGVLVPDISHSLYALWLRGAGEAARERGYVLLICDGQNSVRVIRDQLDHLFREGVAGLVLAGTAPAPEQLKRFLEAGVPLAPDLSRLLGERQATRPLRADLESPALEAAFQYLVELGHRRIAYVAHIDRDEGYVAPLQRLRMACLRRALAAAGVAETALTVVAADGGTACAAGVAALFRDRACPSALVVGAEALAPATLMAIRAARLRIPRDVSLLICGDSGWEEAFDPPLSVVRHDYAGVARAETANLIARIEGDAVVPEVPRFAAEFVVRASCAPPPGIPPGPSRRRGGGAGR